MATNRLTIDGYAQIELNRVSFPITGRVVADLPLKSTFTTAAPAENGMILAVDYVAGEVTLPTGSDAILALHCSTEKEYDPNLPGLNQFKLVASTSSYSSRNQTFYPRLGILSVGERFTSNCICYDTTEFADNAAALAALAAADTTPLYGVPDVTGAIKITATKGTPKVALQVVKKTTVANGDIGVKFVVIDAQ